jgi:hypothetical protein
VLEQLLHQTVSLVHLASTMRWKWWEELWRHFGVCAFPMCCRVILGISMDARVLSLFLSPSRNAPSPCSYASLSCASTSFFLACECSLHVVAGRSMDVVPLSFAQRVACCACSTTICKIAIAIVLNHMCLCVQVIIAAVLAQQRRER